MKTINNTIQEDYVDFENAKLLKEVGFNIPCMRFYTKLRSKMFGIDEHNRYYPIKNTSYKLYTLGEHAALKEKNVIPAPTLSLAQKWLREKHNIHVNPIPNFKTSWNQYHLGIIFKNSKGQVDTKIIKDHKNNNILFNSYEEALELGLQEALKLIKLKQ